MKGQEDVEAMVLNAEGLGGSHCSLNEGAAGKSQLKHQGIRVPALKPHVIVFFQLKQKRFRFLPPCHPLSQTSYVPPLEHI